MNKTMLGEQVIHPLELSIIIPTFNEAENVKPILKAIGRVMEHRSFEVIFVDDDSPDKTADIVREIANQDYRVRCIQRVGRRGLSSACIEGFYAAAAPVVAVIDGDMQHDEQLLPKMLALFSSPDLDLVVGSRYIEDGGFGDWDSKRIRISSFATSLAKRITGVELSDPMSGFFMMRSDAFRRIAHKLSAVGFKILLDIFSSAGRTLNFKELPYEFRSRHFGESKLDAKVALEFLEMLLDKMFGKYLPAKFIMFSLVGSFGVAVHFIALYSLFGTAGIDFQNAQLFATITAMVFNFALNNIFTHHDKKLSGVKWWYGLLSFGLISSIGTIANVGVATYLFEQQKAVWYLSSIAGISMSVVWNYVATSYYTWKAK